MIDAGLPESRDEWPDGILAGLLKFVQGDIVANPPMGYFTHPIAPTLAASRHFAKELSSNGDADDDDFFIYLPETIQPPYGMIATQTCDLVEEDSLNPRWPWIQLIPVYDAADRLDGSDKSLLKKGKGFRYLLHVPRLTQGFFVADFRLSFPVEKSWLPGQERIDGFGSEVLRHRVADRLAYLSGRPAFAGSFVATIQRPLLQALKDLKSNNRVLYEKLNSVVPEIGVRLDSRLRPTNVQLVVISTHELHTDEKDIWQDWNDSFRSLAEANGIQLQAIDFKVLDQSFSAAEYRELTLLPLPNVSPD